MKRTNETICEFYGGSGQCNALSVDICTGHNKSCKFYVSHQQAIYRRDKAIKSARAKGLCDKCKYVEAKCRTSEDQKNENRKYTSV